MHAGTRISPEPRPRQPPFSSLPFMSLQLKSPHVNEVIQYLLSMAVPFQVTAHPPGCHYMIQSGGAASREQGQGQPGIPSENQSQTQTSQMPSQQSLDYGRNVKGQGSAL